MGSGASVKSAKSPPPPQSVQSGDISPVDSISSLLSAYGTEDSGGRYSVDTAATKHSFAEPSPPKLPPKDTLVASTGKLDIVSPLSLSTPLSSKMMEPAREQQQQYGASPPGQQYHRLPSPTTKDSRRPASPQSPERSLETSAPNSSPTKPQIWRRRSLKSDKPLTVPELKLSVSHGSTASPQQVTSSVNSELPSLPKSNASMKDTEAEDSPTLRGFEGVSGHKVRPSPSQKSLPKNPSPDNMGNKKSKESLDGFSRYAQELEQGRPTGALKTPQYSPAKLSPDIQRPPTPEYGKDEAQADGTAIYSPVSPMTPPDETRLLVQGDDDTRPLSIIQEDPDHAEPATSAAPLPGPLVGLPRSPRPVTKPAASPNPATATLAPAPSITTANPTLSHARSTSSISVPTISVSEDGDASTVKAANSPLPPSAAMPTTTMSLAQQPKGIFHEHPTSPTSPTSARPGDPGYFPMRHYLARPIAPGTVLAAPAIKRSQLECFAGHYRFVASRNEGHPLTCQTCSIRDKGQRFACAHCAVRVCKDCCDVLMMNGRNVGQLVEMLQS